jgi:hypothetical protein
MAQIAAVLDEDRRLRKNGVVNLHVDVKDSGDTARVRASAQMSGFR